MTYRFYNHQMKKVHAPRQADVQAVHIILYRLLTSVMASSMPEEYPLSMVVKGTAITNETMQAINSKRKMIYS